MLRTVSAVAIAAALLVACGPKTDDTAGPAVSTSESPRNAAIDPSPITGDPGTTPGANSFTEAQAKGAIESAGYTGVSDLKQGEDGVWMGMATKDGKEAAVTVDYKGSVKPM